MGTLGFEDDGQPKKNHELQNAVSTFAAIDNPIENASLHEPATFLNGHFDLDLVGNPFPSCVRPNFDKKRDPSWVSGHGTFQFVPPSTGVSIAFWHQEFNCPFFYDKGFLKKNPHQSGEFEWTWDPHYEPFKKKEEKGIFLNPYSTYLHHVL